MTSILGITKSVVLGRPVLWHVQRLPYIKSLSRSPVVFRVGGQFIDLLLGQKTAGLEGFARP